MNDYEIVAISSEADSFDLSPSGRRAVISSQNQIFTIATDRGDITVIANDKGASRNESPQWSPDGKYIAFISDRSGRQEIYLTDEEGKNLKKITDLDTDKGPIVWAPDSKSSGLRLDRQEALFLHGCGREDELSSPRATSPRRGRRRFRPTASG